MGILINELLGDFSQIPNLIISDTNIKHTSFRLYCYYASKPNKWTIRNKDINEKLGLSKDTIATCNKNLIDNGWLKRSRCKNRNGTFIGGYDYQIFAVPTIIGKNPNSGKPENGKMPILSNIKNTEPSNLEYFQMMYQVEEEKKKEKRGSRSYTQKPRKQWNSN